MKPQNSLWVLSMLAAAAVGEEYPIEYSGETFFRDCVGRESEKLFVLSFDDGPHENTEYVLDILKEKEAPATFFWIGSNWERRPDLATTYDRLMWRALLEGHTLANHGMTNDVFLLDEVKECHDVISNKVGQYEPHFFRPSQGVYTIESIGQVRDALPDYRFAMWNLDTSDWRDDRQPQDVLDLIEGAMDNATAVAPIEDRPNHRLPRQGSFIMLGHDNKLTMGKLVTNPVVLPSDGSVQQVPLLAAIIDLVRSKGYEIISMDECIGVTPSEVVAPTSFCGTIWEEATQCPSGLACPTGQDAACPDGMSCYGDIVCPTPAPVMAPTVSPMPTVTPTAPSSLQPVWGNTVPISSSSRLSIGWTLASTTVMLLLTAAAGSFCL